LFLVPLLGGTGVFRQHFRMLPLKKPEMFSGCRRRPQVAGEKFSLNETCADG